MQDFGEETCGESPPGRPKHIGGAIILKCILKTCDGGIDWIYLA
jgi:hypothetical protein